MDDLLQRLQAASGPSRELDAEIAEHIGDDRVVPLTAWRYSDEWMRKDDVLGWVASGPNMLSTGDKFIPFYTSSIDAAMTLVPEGWRFIAFDQMRGKVVCRIGGDGYPWVPSPWGARNAATALCIAALQARKEPGNA